MDNPGERVNSKRIPLVFASNNQGCLMLGIALYSLLTNRSPDTYYVIYILDDGISCPERERISSLAEEYSCEIHFISIVELLQKHSLKSFKEWPSAMWGRLFLPSLLPFEKRILYLDIDILVMGDLSELFEYEVGNELASVVYEEEKGDMIGRKKMLGISPTHTYFNSGVMLMELERMRREGIEDLFYSAFARLKDVLICPDQDILNVVMQNRVRGLHPKWNWPARHTRRQMLLQGSSWGGRGRAVAVEASLNPVILHFWGCPKPVQYNYNFHRRLYRKVWLSSPWKDVPYSGSNRLINKLHCIRNIPKDTIAHLRLFWLRRRMQVK